MVEENILKDKLEGLKEKADLFSNITDKVVKENSKDLDEIMEYIKHLVTQDTAISTESVERAYAELTNLLYFMADRIEKLNIFSDVSRSNAKEVYNNNYIAVSSEKDEKGKSIRTVNENVALAESNAQYEYTMNSIYEHAYKSLKLKLDLGLEMVTTLKNILKKRMNEDYLNFQVSTNNKTLPED